MKKSGAEESQDSSSSSARVSPRMLVPGSGPPGVLVPGPAVTTPGRLTPTPTSGLPGGGSAGGGGGVGSCPATLGAPGVGLGPGLGPAPACSDSEPMTDTSSVQSSDMDRSSLRSVDERVEVSPRGGVRMRVQPAVREQAAGLG